MKLKKPKFWDYKKPSLLSYILFPLSKLFEFISLIKIEKNKQIFNPDYEAKYRRLSIREVARIQTYPDDFIFYYESVLDGYKMVGNSVPVQLAYVIGNSIINQFELIRFFQV